MIVTEQQATDKYYVQLTISGEYNGSELLNSNTPISYDDTIYQYPLEWYDTEEEYLARLDELGIIIEEDGSDN